MDTDANYPKHLKQRFKKGTSQIARLTNTEDIWRELVDPSEADSAPEDVEDHEEWIDRQEEK